MRISSVDTEVRSERSRISSATTANPRPRSPACAAMIAAFSASRFVCPAMSSMTRTMSPISCERSARSAERDLRFVDGDLDLAHAVDRAARPRSALRWPRPSRSARAPTTASPTSRSPRWSHSSRPSRLAVCVANDEKLSVFVATSLIDAIISSIADEVCSTNSESVSAMRLTSSIDADISRIDVDVSSAFARELFHARAHVVDRLIDLRHRGGGGSRWRRAARWRCGPGRASAPLI